MRLITALLAATLLSSPAMAGKVVTVRDDAGGLVMDYYMRVLDFKFRDVTVRIGGVCASSCTMYLGANRVCVERDAQLWFHEAKFPSGKRSDRISDLMLDQYPAGVQRYILQHGGLKESWIKLKGKELTSLVTVCP